MPMRRVLLLALVSCLVGAAPAGAAIPRGWLGVHVDGPMTDGRAPATEWRALGASGAGSVRAAFRWSEIEPAPGAFDFSAPDAIVRAAAERGVRVLPVVHWTPAWAAAQPGRAGSPPRDPAEIARVLRALVGRYGPDGSLWREAPALPREPIRAWQIWNEPSIAKYWSVQPYQAGYVRLLRAAHRALHAADRGATVVAAGFPNRSWEDVAKLYRAGARRWMDAVALHPYTSRPTNVLRVIDRARAVMRRHGDARKPVWVTELSWPAAEGKVRGTPGFETTERGQAQRLEEGVRLLAAARARLRIAQVYWYTWLSADRGSPNSFDYSGLRRWRAGRIVDAPALRVFSRLARR